MGEYLPDGSHQSGYATECPGCGRTATVNMQGQGKCEHCGVDIQPGVQAVSDELRRRYAEQPPLDSGEDTTSGPGWPD